MYDTLTPPYTYTGSEHIDFINNRIALTFPINKMGYRFFIRGTLLRLFLIWLVELTALLLNKLNSWRTTNSNIQLIN